MTRTTRACQLLSLAGVVGSLAVPGTALAAPVTLCGPTVCYEYDNNPSVNAGITLFGAPTLLLGSDTLAFTPTAFSATSNAGTFAVTTATFQFSRVYSTNGAEIADITVSESGDYQILGGGAVSASIRLQSLDTVNNGGGGFPQVAITNPNPSFTANTPTGTFLSPGSLANWNLSGSLNPAAVFQDLATEVNFQIQNTLTAFTSLAAINAGNPQYAFIQKKLTITTTLVPIPAAAWLFGSAVLGMGFLRRRRAAA